MMPVGARGFTLIESDGKDEAGEPKFKMTDLSAIQGAPPRTADSLPRHRRRVPSPPRFAPPSGAPRPVRACCGKRATTEHAAF